MATELKPFDLNALQPFYAPAIDETKLANVKLRLPENLTHTRKSTRRLTAILNKTAKAIETISKLPTTGESLHCVLNGSFALWDFVPAVLQLSGRPITELWLATLGFSKHNVEALDQLAQEGQLGRLHLLCSHYFSAADAAIYAPMVEVCRRRNWRIAAMRTHAKALLISTGPHRLVVESSANLRSCHNVEQATVFNDGGLYDFHAKWIDALLTKGQSDENATTASNLDR